MTISYRMIFLQCFTIARHLAPGHNYSSYFCYSATSQLNSTPEVMKIVRKCFARDLFRMALTPVIAAALSLQIYALGSRLPQSVKAAGKIALNNSTGIPMPFRVGETL